MNVEGVWAKLDRRSTEPTSSMPISALEQSEKLGARVLVTESETGESAVVSRKTWSASHLILAHQFAFANMCSHHQHDVQPAVAYASFMPLSRGPVALLGRPSIVSIQKKPLS